MTFKDKGRVKHLVDLETHICANPSSAKGALARTLLMKNNPARGKLMRIDTEEDIPYLLDADAGSHTSHAHWVYRSASVNLHSHDNLGEGGFIPVVEAVQKFLEDVQSYKDEEAGVHVEQKVVDAKKQSLFEVGDTMTIDVTVKNAMHNTVRCLRECRCAKFQEEKLWRRPKDGNIHLRDLCPQTWHRSNQIQLYRRVL